MRGSSATKGDARRWVMLLLLIGVWSHSAAAQAGLVELGVDGSIEHVVDSPSSTTINLPVARLRVGYFFSPQFSLEPLVAVNVTRGNGDFTTGRIGLGALWHFTASRTGAQPYVRPFIEHEFTSFSEGTETRTTGAGVVGVGLGVKLPLADRLRWRLEGAYEHSTARSRILGFVGVSFFRADAQEPSPYESPISVDFSCRGILRRAGVAERSESDARGL